MSGKKTPEQVEILLMTTRAMSSISMVMSLTVCFSYWRFNHLRKFAFWLVVMLAASDVLSSIAMFITPSTDTACYFSGFLIHYAQVASFLWTTCIAYTLYNSIRLNFERVESAKLRMHIYGWGLPAVLLRAAHVGK